MQALHVLGFQTFVAGYDFEGDFFAFIERFESGADDGRVMHENVLAGTLGDKAKPFLVIEPLYFATSHIQLLTFLRSPLKIKTDTTGKQLMSANYFQKRFMPQFDARLSVGAAFVKHLFLILFNLQRLAQKFRQMIQQRRFADDQPRPGFLGGCLQFRRPFSCKCHNWNMLR